MRLCMFWGLWWWHDLTEELEGRGGPLSPHRLWRTLASALCLMQAALCARVLGAAGRLLVPSGLGPQPAAVGAISREP